MFIYEIINTIDGKRYIGQTSRSTNTRWNEHRHNLNLNKHANQYLQNAWNKYGEKSFTFKKLAEANSLDELNKLEEKYVTGDNIYNLRSGGNRFQLSEESKQKISRSRTGKPGGQLGSKRSPLSPTRRLKMSMLSRPERYQDIVDSNGKVFHIDSLREFCRIHQLFQVGLRSVVVTKKCYHYKGWRLATPETIGVPYVDADYMKRGDHISKARLVNPYPRVISPNGTIYTVEQLSAFCRVHSLSKSNMSMLLRGKKASYMGWTVKS